MLKFSVCIEMVFNKYPIQERIRQVARSGARGFEFWNWQNKDLELIGKCARANKLKVAGFVGNPGVPIVQSSQKKAFQEIVAESLEVAKKLRARTLIITTGQEVAKISRTRQHTAIVSCLKSVAKMCEDARVTLALEPLNTKIDHKGYYLDRSAEAFKIIGEVGSPAVKVLYDIYHMQIMEGDIIRTMTGNSSKIGHIHVGDTPGRNEPGTGEINYPNVFSAIKKMKFVGFTGMEFVPTGNHLHAVEQVLAMS